MGSLFDLDGNPIILQPNAEQQGFLSRLKHLLADFVVELHGPVPVVYRKENDTRQVRNDL